jgi:hypothetical protein
MLELGAKVSVLGKNSPFPNYSWKSLPPQLASHSSAVPLIGAAGVGACMIWAMEW